MMRLAIATATAQVIFAMQAMAAPTEAHCQQFAKIAESLATAREHGVTQAILAEERIKRQNAALAHPKSEALTALRNERRITQLEEFIYANKIAAVDARLVGYKKCLAGDFND